MEALQNYFTELASLFGYKYDDSFFEYLKSISIPNNTVCGKEIIKGEGGWKCEDCELYNNSIYCNECFKKEKHIGHKTSFDPVANGFCDCGVKSILKPEGFCDKHKGDFNNTKDLMNFIESSIKKTILDLINDIYNKIFLLFIDKIKAISDNNEDEEDEDEEVDENEGEIYKMFDSLENFGNRLYKNNLSLFYFFTLKFTENFPYETRHKCFSYEENKKLVSFIKKDKEKMHVCICPFFQVMIYALKKRKTKQNTNSFFNLFFQTYRNKSVTSLCFLNCFSELFYNNNLKKFREMEFQLIDENLSLIVCQEHNFPFLELCFKEIYLLCDYFLKEKDYDKLESLYSRFYRILNDISSGTIIGKIGSNEILLNIIINICCLPNNENVFENKIKFQIFQTNGYKFKLANIEIYCLRTIINLTHIINYDDKKIVDFIFNIIFEKIYKFKRYKESLPDKIFSPHLIIIKCYSLFLNRYCFNYSLKNKCDLLDSFKNFLDIFPQAKEINIFIFKELISLFGFIISQLYSFFIFFGTNMLSYYLNYFNNKIIYINCDIALIKYLLTQPEIKEQFYLQNISFLSNIASSNKFFQNLINEGLNINNIEFIGKSEENNLRYINSIFEYLYLMIRDNLSMEKIAFGKVEFKKKVRDEVYEKLYQSERNTIQNLIKNEIIHFFLGNKNLVKRDDCIDYVTRTFDKKYIYLVDEMIKNNCDKIILSNSLIEFSLKKEMLKNIDIDYIISQKERKNAYEYMTNFKSKNLDISNINIIEPLNIQKRLMKNVYQSFYNEKNIDELIKLYNLTSIENENGKVLNFIFHSNLKKILSFAFKLCSTDLLDEDFKIKLLEKMKQIEDKQFNNEKNNDKKNIYLKEKLIKAFEKKIELINEKIISSNIIIEEEKLRKESETCVYCLRPIYKDLNILDYFGKISYYFSDYMTDLLKKKPEGKRKKARKFVSCNHKIHFKCFNKLINIFNEFECPLCKKLSNFILYDFSPLLENNSNLIKGINYIDEKINLDDFFKINEDNKLKEFFLFNISVFENYCSKLLKKKVSIIDINGNKNLFEQLLKLIIEDFEEFTMYYPRVSNKQDQIEIWKNVMYNIRLMFQYKILNLPSNILKIIEKILIINKPEILDELLVQYDFCDIINTFIMVSFILFEPNEENKEKIKNILQNNIILYLIYIVGNNKNNNINNFLSNNIKEIQKVLNLFLLKYKICLLLFNEKEENVKINISNEQIISFIQTNSDLINILNTTKKDNYNIIIKDKYLEIPEFNIINLPENGIEFLNKTNGNCIYCHKKYLNSYLCLLCGNKMCNNIDCFIENGSKRGREYSLIYHSKKCSGGIGLFLNIINGEIVYLLKRRFIFPKIYIYLNDFGDILKDKNLSDEYKLNKKELEKGIMKFIDVTYRKNYIKTYYKEKNNNKKNN